MVKKIIRISLAILKGYWLWLKYKFNRPYRIKVEKEAKRRLLICESCENFNNNFRICNICGCFMDIKTKSLDEICYDNKW
jgi:hypothetical protein